MKRAALPTGLTGPQHYWVVMVALSQRGGSFAIPDVHGLTNGVAYKTVKTYVSDCLKRGAIRAVGTRPTVKNRTATLYQVIDLRAEAPVSRRASYTGDRGRRVQQLWTAMRALRAFSAGELAVTASTDDLGVSVRMARSYIAALVRAGYVAEIGQRTAIGQVAQWRLLPTGNTGPRPPAITRAGLVDRNLRGSVNVTGLGRAA